MKHLLNTLYIVSEDAYLTLDGENVAVHLQEKTNSFPLHTIESIISFSYKGASPALMGKCAEYGISLSFFSPRGRYLASTVNLSFGNVLLRKQQYDAAENKSEALKIAKNFMIGKLYNSKYVLLRCARDHELQVDSEKIKRAASVITVHLKNVNSAADTDEIRGIEGKAAAEYFGAFDEMILQNKKDFYFERRTRRPPTDNVNALLSFAYSMLAVDCASALRSVGLDPYMGFMHTLRSGRKSLALDLMEELRSVYADRFVLCLINNRILNKDDFYQYDNSAVILQEDGRKKFLTEWQKKKKEPLTHPYLEEKISWGLIPYVQALLLARYLRGDMDQYPPFFWK